jgi:uncharacterized membrane protein YsdA (DUF1294 family)
MNCIPYIAIVVAIWNIITFAFYGADKSKARKNKWRIKESTLIACAFLMGGVGAMLGMLAFHHKTKHLKFLLLVPLALMLNIGVAACLIYYLS